MRPPRTLLAVMRAGEIALLGQMADELVDVMAKYRELGLSDAGVMLAVGLVNTAMADLIEKKNECSIREVLEQALGAGQRPSP